MKTQPRRKTTKTKNLKKLENQKMPTPQSKTIGLGPHFFGQFEKNDYCPGNDAETIRQEVALAKEKLRKHPKFFERFGSTKPKRKFS